MAAITSFEACLTDLSVLSDSDRLLTTDTARRLRYLGLQTRPNVSKAEDRLKDIVTGLTAPSDHETSIELPFRLILSPHRSGRFLTPRPKMRRQGEPTPLWTAELEWNNPVERRGVGEVRAVWSTDFRKKVFIDEQAKLPPHGAYAPWEIGPEDGSGQRASRFRATLDGLDRHEIVVLSSVYGLPVLARPGEDGKLTGDQLAPPREYLLNDINTKSSDEDSAVGTFSARTVIRCSRA